MNVENTMKEGVVGFFEDKIKVSVTTHFNWIHTDSNTWSTITKSRIDVKVDPGKNNFIFQLFCQMIYFYLLNFLEYFI